MTFFPESIDLRATAAAHQWRSTSSPTGWRWSVRYSSIPAVVCAFEVFLIITTAVVASSLYSFIQETNNDDLTRDGTMAIVIAAIFVPMLHNRGLYNPAALVNWTSQVRNILGTWTVTFLVFASVAFALKVGSDFSRGTILLFSVVGLMAILLHHALWRIIVERLLNSGALRGRRSILLCLHESPWAEDSIQKTARDLVRHGYNILQFFHLGIDIPKTQIMQQVIALARGSDVEEIFFAADIKRWPEIRHIVQELCVLPVPLTLLPDECTAALFQRPSRQLGGTVGVEFRRAPLSLAERFFKRLLDLAGSIAGLIVLLPMFVIVALAIKLDSPGPVLFRQTRHGFNSKPFRIVKFRTMTVLEDGATIQQAMRGDSRVTRTGYWLRKTSIDELPQLFNVLKGDMSLVGPRPHAVAHDNHYGDLISRYAFRHHVKPGITGWAQIHGCRGQTPTVHSMKERVDLDIWYVDNWSLLTDFHIILRTVVEVLRGRNAY